jgi:hypothetical protein
LRDDLALQSGERVLFSAQLRVRQSAFLAPRANGYLTTQRFLVFTSHPMGELLYEVGGLLGRRLSKRVPGHLAAEIPLVSVRAVARRRSGSRNNVLGFETANGVKHEFYVKFDEWFPRLTDAFAGLDSHLVAEPNQRWSVQHDQNA